MVCCSFSDLYGQAPLTSEAVICMVEMSERGSSGFAIHRDGGAAAAEKLVCPKPRRLASVAHTLKQPLQKLQSHGFLPLEGGDAGCELMDILFCKTGSESSIPPFSGSPPSRCSNPLIHDLQFNQKKLLPAPIVLEQRSHSSVKKSSCGSSYGANPSRRVEGFGSPGSESRRGVPTLA